MIASQRYQVGNSTTKEELVGILGGISRKGLQHAIGDESTGGVSFFRSFLEDSLITFHQNKEEVHASDVVKRQIFKIDG